MTTRPRPRRGTAVAPLAALLLALAAGPAAARALDDAEVTQFSLDQLLAVEIYSTSEYVRKVSGAPASASVVTAEEIRAHGYRNLTDILRSLPGLYVAYDRNYSYLGSRGFGKVGDWNSRVLFMLDGHRVNENVYDGAYIGNDFILDVGLIERVEYVAGPAAAMLYGNNAFFGVVNVVTKSGKQLDGGELALGVGSAGARDTRASLGKRLDNGLDLLLSVSGLDNDGRAIAMPEFGGTARNLDHERAKRLFARLGLGGLNLELARSERRKGVPNASYGQVFNDPRSRTDDGQTSLDLSYNHALGEESAISGRLYYGRYDFSGNFPYDLAAAAPADIRIYRDRAHGGWWGIDLKYVGARRAGHKLLIGADYQRDLRRDQQGGYLGSPDILDDRRDSRQWGLYVHDEIEVRDDLVLNVGARHDSPTVGKGELNPRLGLIWHWRPNTTLKALYGSAFRPPNVFELYYLSDDNYRPNPDLGPERIKTRELVLEHDLGSGGRLNATLFHNHIRNLIEYVPQGGADGLMGTPDDIFRFENAGHARSTGLELGYERALPAGGRLRASYTGPRSRDGLGEEPENSPRHLAKLNWRQPLFDGWLDAGLEIQHVGARRSPAGSTTGAATLTNLTLATRRLLPGTDLALTVFNLFDRRIADPAAYFHAPLDYIRQDGREWRLQLRVPF
jgi:iron complex outermembrane receptor protein